MRDRRRRSTPRLNPTSTRGRALGFTLLELLIVMTIIGILMGFILNAAMGSARHAEETATQGLISKLDSGIADRIEALLETRPDPTFAHQILAAVYNGPSAGQPTIFNTVGTGVFNQSRLSGQRAQVFAMYDYLKSELPDVFYIPATGDPDIDSTGNYPINFVGTAWDGNVGTQAAYFLPMDTYPASATFPITRVSNVTGIYGASFSARAALYKNLGNIAGVNHPMLPSGYDGTDNDGDGNIDELKEGYTQNGDGKTIVAAVQTAITQSLTNHQHKTARAEMLYALLVEGQGPLGSAFNRDDFTDKQVMDTDNDGLPEFVDAWGQPLQFYRWPVFFQSDLQKGSDLINSPGIPPYGTVFEARQQDPLDANQQLMAPQWWANTSSNGTNFGPGFITPPAKAPVSPAAWMFHLQFHPLIEPLSGGGKNPVQFWDRGATFYPRRAFYSRFLIASSGLDGASGIARLDMFAPSLAINVSSLVVENQARQTDLNVVDPIYFLPVTPGWTNPVTFNPLPVDGLDDITNHNLQAPGVGNQ